MLAARESKRARFSASEEDPVLLLSAMRAPSALAPSTKPPPLHGVARLPPNWTGSVGDDGATEAPLQDFVRQMPGNSADDVRAAVALLHDSFWLLEVGRELTTEGALSVDIDWGFAVNGYMIGGATLMLNSKEANWVQVHRGEDGAIDQHRLPVSLAPDEEPAFYLLRVRGARDPVAGTRPVVYALCPVSLPENDAATSRVTALMDAVHMNEAAAAAVRAARSGAMSVGARTITVRGRAAGQEIAWETARLLASAGRLVRRTMA